MAVVVGPRGSVQLLDVEASQEHTGGQRLTQDGRERNPNTKQCIRHVEPATVERELDGRRYNLLNVLSQDL